MHTNNPKKVLMITVRSDMGGGPKHVYDLSRTLVNSQDFLVSIASPKDAPFYDKFLSVAQSHIVIPHRRFSLVCFIKILFFCLKNNYKIIHSHGRGAGYYSRPMKFLGFKIIHTFHGVHHEKGNLISELKLKIDQKLRFLTDQFISVSEDEKAIATSLKLSSLKNITVVHNGVDIEFFNLPKKDNETIIFGYLARFNFQKGLDILIDFVKQFKFDSPEERFKILVAGDGEEYQKISKKIKDEKLEDIIILKGATSNPEHFLSELDWYISFARWEGLPLSVLEAMASKTPCFLSNVTGHKEIATDQKAILFDIDSYDDFKLKLSKILKQDLDQQKITNAAFQAINEKHSLQIMTDQTKSLY